MSGITGRISGEIPFKSLIQVDSPQTEQVDNYPNYPNSRVVFSCNSGWDDIWKGKLFNQWNSACRMMEFKRTKDFSMLDRFVLMGYRNGKVSLTLYFSTNTIKHGNSFEKYLMAEGFACIANGLTLPGQKYCEAATHEELRTLFEIISTHNEIPEPYLQKLEEIVEKGCCERTPPLVPIFKQPKYTSASKLFLASYEMASESKSSDFVNSFLKTRLYMHEENVDLIMNNEGRTIKEFYNQYKQSIKIVKYTVRLSPDWEYTQVIDHYLLAFCHKKLVQLGTPNDEDKMVASLTRTKFANIPF